MKTAEINGIRMAYRDEGQGPPLLFVHGFALSHAMWREQIAEFSSSHRCIAPDLRGFGASAVTEGTVLMEQHADDLAALLDEIGVTEPVVLCGLSMGGYVAWQFVRRHRRRLKGLILCDTRAIADTADGVVNRRRMAELVLRNGSEAAATAMIPALFASGSYEQRTALVEDVRQTILNTNPHGIAAAALGMAVRPDVSSELPAMDRPALLIVGAEDRISTVTEMQAIAAALPNARLEVIPDAGHMAPLENPAPVNAAIRAFLKALESDA